MTTDDLRQAVMFLGKVFVGQADEERLLRTITAIKAEIKKRENRERGRTR